MCEGWLAGHGTSEKRRDATEANEARIWPCSGAGWAGWAGLECVGGAHFIIAGWLLQLLAIHPQIRPLLHRHHHHILSLVATIHRVSVTAVPLFPSRSIPHPPPSQASVRVPANNGIGPDSGTGHCRQTPQTQPRVNVTIAHHIPHPATPRGGDTIHFAYLSRHVDTVAGIALFTCFPIIALCHSPPSDPPIPLSLSSPLLSLPLLIVDLYLPPRQATDTLAT